VARRLRITSTTNAKLKAVRRLRRARVRRTEGVFVADGERAVRCALDSGARVLEVFAAPELFLGPREVAAVALAEARGARVVELAPAAFASISDLARPDGIAAVVESRPATLAQIRPGSLVLVAAGVERPGNLGTIVRTACAAGADAVVACDCATDVFHPEVVRGSVGTLFHVPVAESSREATVAWLREQGVRIVAATPSAPVPHWAGDFEAPVALVVGSERYGLEDAWLDAADETVRIPMSAPADSLNVAVAAGVVLFEAVRAREATSSR
jgi:TrmH family RNA methyltransferase